jgi:hypothetical protein
LAVVIAVGAFMTVQEAGGVETLKSEASSLGGSGGTAASAAPETYQAPPAETTAPPAETPAPAATPEPPASEAADDATDAGTPDDRQT